MTRVALYTRVSTEEQAKEGFSLPAQAERLRAFAAAKQWTIVQEYVDAGYSGRDTKRPGYKALMADKDRWDMLLVVKMDRIHRSSRNFLAMMDDLRKHNKEFTSISESIDTSTAMGRFVMGVISGIAQLESEQTGERAFTGMRQKAESGQGSLGRPAPYGYRYKDGVLHVVDEEAVHVRWMFDRAREGMSRRAIARELNENGITTRNGKQWTVWNVGHILKNITYHGHVMWSGIKQEHKHEAIVEEES